MNEFFSPTSRKQLKPIFLLVEFFSWSYLLLTEAVNVCIRRFSSIYPFFSLDLARVSISISSYHNIEFFDPPLHNFHGCFLQYVVIFFPPWGTLVTSTSLVNIEFSLIRNSD